MMVKIGVIFMPFSNPTCHFSCLLYTSDAADEEDSVDLGGRRIIKKLCKSKFLLYCISAGRKNPLQVTLRVSQNVQTGKLMLATSFSG